MTLVVAAQGPCTGFFMWNNRNASGLGGDGVWDAAATSAPAAPSPSAPMGDEPTASTKSGGKDVETFEYSSCSDTGTAPSVASAVRGVLPYTSAGVGVLFSSMAWHRSVIPAEQHWPFEVKKRAHACVLRS